MKQPDVDGALVGGASSTLRSLPASVIPSRPLEADRAGSGNAVIGEGIG